jgi:hypothetical protein
MAQHSYIVYLLLPSSCLLYLVLSQPHLLLLGLLPTNARFWLLPSHSVPICTLCFSVPSLPSL